MDEMINETEILLKMYIGKNDDYEKK